MKQQEEQKAKLLKLEKLVDEDCGNGRHLKKKIEKKLQELGLCQKEFMEELQKLKAEG